jgi:hypothetical protein
MVPSGGQRVPSPARRGLFTLLLLIPCATPAAAKTNGIVGYSDIGCADCHEAQGAATPTIAIVGPITVAAGSEVTYQVVVTSHGPTQVAAGFNFAAEAGDVKIGTDTGVRRAENREMRRFELTHTGPRDNDGDGQATWSFIWLAPNTPGDYMLFAAGNSVDFDTRALGDAANFTVLTVRVGGADPTPTPTVTPDPACAGDCDGNRTVAINELIGGVNIALGAATVTTCPAIDTNGDGSAAINELVAAVSRALGGC